MGIVQIDGQPFKQWYKKKYGVTLGIKKNKGKTDEAPKEEEKRSSHVICKQRYRESKQKLDPMVDEQFQSGRLLHALLRDQGRVAVQMAMCLKAMSCNST